MKDDILEKALASMKAQSPEPSAQNAAMGRVSEKLGDPSGSAAPVDDAPAVLRGCADIQSLIPALIAGTLSPGRALLVKDHTRSCVPCRRALNTAKSGSPARASLGAGEAPRSRPLSPILAMAAVLVLAAGAGAYIFLNSYSATGPVATVDSLDGFLFSPADQKAVASGAVIPAGKSIRTGRSAGAVVRLPDGSRVEMAERSEIAVRKGLRGTTIDLSRGRVIVQAAKQRDGHLFVKTPDCLVSVTGTVFAVSQGTRGARVSVLEGEVRVDDGKKEKVLHRGDQAVTNAVTERVAIEEDFSWSRDRAAFLELSGEISRVKREMSLTTGSWAGRHSTELLDAMPAKTAVYAAIPNVSETLATFYEKLAPRLAANPVLASWWAQGPGAPQRQAEVARLVEALRTWGSYLGEEIALSVLLNAEGKPGSPLVLTTLARPGFRDFLESQLARTGVVQKVLIIDSAAGLPAARGETLIVWIENDRVAASLDPEALAAIGKPGFAGSSFHARLSEAYREGVDLLIGADLQALLSRAERPEGDVEFLRRSGVLDAEYAILRMRSTGEESMSRASLTFRSERSGIAAWLASPAPMGALSFVSSSATGALALVTRDPALLVDDVITMVTAESPNFPSRLAAVESEYGIRIREDLAATLGGDVALAVDGPVVPSPGWKAVIEVYDAPRLQATLERLVTLMDAAQRKRGKSGMKLVSEEASGLTIHGVRFDSGSTPLQYAFVDGYVVLAPRKALVLKAAEVHRTGDVLLTSPKVRALMPKDGPLDFSMLAFQDVGSLFASIASSVAPSQNSALAELRKEGASLAWAWAGPSEITFGSSGAGLTDLVSVAAGTSAVTRPGTERR
ncbi:MAG: hypothetical protein DIJKHBIC_00279 [Thermoanaerobaculia bacterium]|nr:hypothetical protein [Thermoanaerobaculia bacterium]